MWRQVISQAAGRSHAAVCGGLPQLCHLTQQEVDLLLLARNDLVQLFDQVFRGGGFDLQIGQTLVDGFVVRHRRI